MKYVHELNGMAARVVAMCKKRGWSLHWTERGAYLHLESSELIEAIRGKHGDPDDEAGDVLLVLMSITEHAGIPFSRVVSNAKSKLGYLENAPPYPGEERTAQPSTIQYVLEKLETKAKNKSEFADSVLSFFDLGPEHRFSVHANVFKELDLVAYLQGVTE